MKTNIRQAFGAAGLAIVMTVPAARLGAATTGADGPYPWADRKGRRRHVDHQVAQRRNPVGEAR
jgi:hypothetical protein